MLQVAEVRHRCLEALLVHYERDVFRDKLELFTGRFKVIINFSFFQFLQIFLSFVESGQFCVKCEPPPIRVFSDNLLAEDRVSPFVRNGTVFFQGIVLTKLSLNYINLNFPPTVLSRL